MTVYAYDKSNGMIRRCECSGDYVLRLLLQGFSICDEDGKIILTKWDVIDTAAGKLKMISKSSKEG